MGSTACVIPYRRTDEHRARALEWVLGKYQAQNLRVVLAEASSLGPWVKGTCVREGLESVDADTVVVADADVWSDGIWSAIAVVERGAAWAIPFFQVHRLSEQGTEKVLAGAHPRTQPVERKPYMGAAGGGIVVAKRETLLEIPMDPRYENWGQEDASLGHALSALVGRPWRGRENLWHLYHPLMPRMTRKRGSAASWALYGRYLRASKNPEAMKTLIGEALESLNAAQHPSDTHPLVHVHGGL